MFEKVKNKGNFVAGQANQEEEFKIESSPTDFEEF